MNKNFGNSDQTGFLWKDEKAKNANSINFHENKAVD